MRILVPWVALAVLVFAAGCGSSGRGTTARGGVDAGISGSGGVTVGVGGRNAGGAGGAGSESGAVSGGGTGGLNGSGGDAGAGNGGSTGSAGAGGTTSTTDGGTASALTVGDYVGVNGLITDSLAMLAPIGVVREYHNWSWLGNNNDDQAYPQTLYTPNIPDFDWDWDGFFAGLKAMGASGFPAVQLAASWVNGGKLPPADGDPTAAASYIAHGDTMFQIAARWGKTKVDDAKLKLEPGQTRSSGLGTVDYFEDFNEQDGNGFTGDTYAAMASADYDGDQQRLGATIGVKNADPNAKLVMGGLSGAYVSDETWVASITKFLDAARAWSASNRGGSFPADVLNVHYYSFGKGAPAPALSPEDDGVEAKLGAVVAYRDANLPGEPVWWTEFGYDTTQNSSLHAPVLGQNSAFIVQGQWLVRELLAGLAAGIERATLFELDDTCTPPESACDGPFATSGLLTHPDSKPKAAWFFVATFRARLLTMTFTAEQTSGASDVKVYAFRDTKKPGGALVVWAPTSNATVHANYALALPSGATSVTAVALADQQQNGVETKLTPANGAVALDVSETPTIVLYSP